MISCVILSAGLSSRFGSPKALAQIGQTTVIEHILEQLLGTAISEIIVVLGAEHERIKPYILNHKKISVVYNKSYNLGQTSSFKVGTESVSEFTKGILLLPVDFPFVKTETIEALINVFRKENPSVLIPVHKGVKGHPPIFNKRLKNEFLELDNSAGLNLVSRAHQGETLLFETNDEGVLESFNTPEEFMNIKKRFALK